jgi:predicted nucleic acid-binding protein
VIEALYSARAPDDFRQMEGELASLGTVLPGPRTYELALRALRDLCGLRPNSHRLPPSDVLIAAVAHEHGVGVLHYDAHYDRLAEVLDFESVWLAPRGTLD